MLRHNSLSDTPTNDRRDSLPPLTFEQFLTEQFQLSENDVQYIINHSYATTIPGASKAIKLLSMAFNYLGQAINTTGNTLLFRQKNQVDIASVATTYQSCFRNTLNGGMAASGKFISGARKSGDTETLREIVVASYLLGTLAAFASTVIYSASYFILPHIVRKETGLEASYYLLITAWGNFAVILLTTLQQFAYAYDHWLAQISTTFATRFPPVALSYLLMQTTSWSPAINIGLGNLIAPVLTYLAMEVWCRRQSDLGIILKFPAVRLTQTSTSETTLLRPTESSQTCLAMLKSISKKHLWSMFTLFVVLAFQRATEWVNVFLITLILGNMQNKNLEMIAASLQVMSIFNLFSQGIGTGVTMDAEQEKKALERILILATQLDTTPQPGNFISELNDVRLGLKNAAETHYQKLKNIVVFSQILGLGVNAAVAVSLYFSREILVKQFASSTATPEDNQSAEKLLCVVGASLVADAVRLISCSSLVPWDKNLLTNMISLISMTIIGIPVGYAIAREKQDEAALYLFGIVRTVMISIAALFNLAIIFNELHKDKQKISELFDTRGPVRIVTTSSEHDNEARNIRL